MINKTNMNNPSTKEIEEAYFSIISKGCHDIRNYVALINSEAQILEHRIPELSNNPTFKMMTEDISQLTNLLSAISKYRYAGKIEKTSVSMKNIIQECVDEYTENHALSDTINTDCTSRLTRDNHTLSCRLPKTLPSIQGDYKKLKEAFSCLLDNAYEYSYASSPILIIAKKRGNSVLIRITNTGEPLSEDLAANIFTPFYSGNSKHFGLGLSIAQKTIAAHGGNIHISCSDNITVTVTLPIC